MCHSQITRYSCASCHVKEVESIEKEILCPEGEKNQFTDIKKCPYWHKAYTWSKNHDTMKCKDCRKKT